MHVCKYNGEYYVDAITRVLQVSLAARMKSDGGRPLVTINKINFTLFERNVMVI